MQESVDLHVRSHTKRASRAVPSKWIKMLADLMVSQRRKSPQKRPGIIITINLDDMLQR